VPSTLAPLHCRFFSPEARAIRLCPPPSWPLAVTFSPCVLGRNIPFSFCPLAYPPPRTQLVHDSLCFFYFSNGQDFLSSIPTLCLHAASFPLHQVSDFCSLHPSTTFESQRTPLLVRACNRFPSHSPEFVCVLQVPGSLPMLSPILLVTGNVPGPNYTQCPPRPPSVLFESRMPCLPPFSPPGQRYTPPSGTNIADRYLLHPCFFQKPRLTMQ